jgi:probable rRNA maturation factor
MIEIDLQNDQGIAHVPELSLFQRWVESSLQKSYANLEQSIRIVDESESRTLNRDYRAQDKPTNVLSFPAEISEYLDYDNLGDLVICAQIVEQEAEQQGKSILAHWAHMVVHGMLHLQGYDHITDEQAEEMESLEIEILASLGQTNPYFSNNP